MLRTLKGSEDIVQEPDASLKKRRVGTPDVNPGGASSLTADTPKRSESEREPRAENDSVLVGRTVVTKSITGIHLPAARSEF